MKGLPFLGMNLLKYVCIQCFSVLKSDDTQGLEIDLLRMNVQEFDHLLELVHPHTHLRRAINENNGLIK